MEGVSYLHVFQLAVCAGELVDLPLWFSVFGLRGVQSNAGGAGPDHLFLLP